MPNVLVVDDNVQLAENLAEIITESGLGDAVIADSGLRALELLRTKKTDLMITDMRMPGMDGSELIRRARATDPDLPVIVTSAYTGDEDLSQATREGLLAVYGKPVPMLALLELVPRVRRIRPILIVDDDIALAEGISVLLRERGLSTVTAHSLSQLERVGGRPTVALVDLRIPGTPDCASLDRVKSRFPEIVIIAMTAFRSEVEVLLPLPFIEKPFEAARLMELVESLC